MNKMKRIFALLFMLISLIGLASCSKSFGAAITSVTTTRNTLTVEASFDEHPDIMSGKAVPYVRIYVEEAKDEYNDLEKDENIKLKPKKVSGDATFSDLEAGKKYKVTLFIAMDKKDYEIASEYASTEDTGTSEENPFLIKTAKDFLSMEKDPDGFYKLENDIDFSKGEDKDTLQSIFSSANKFKGVFDGNNKTIKNFKISSTSHAGVFGYTSGATIKNLRIEGAEIQLGSGRSTANLGILIGTAEDTVVENVTIVEPKLVLVGNSTATINVGFLVGSFENGSLINNRVINGSMEISKARLELNAGLVAGLIKGQPLPAKEEGEKNRFVENNLATGSISATMYFPSSKGYVNIGGFAGAVGAPGLMKNNAVDVDIKIMKDVNSTHKDEYNLAVGGFVGYNQFGGVNIESSVAVADIHGYAGTLKDDTDNNFSDNKMSNNPVYFGGFAGRILSTFNKIKDCYYIEKTSPLALSMKLEEVIEPEKPEGEGTPEGTPEGNPEEGTPEATAENGEAPVEPETPAEPEIKKLVYSSAENNLGIGYTDLEERIINMMTSKTEGYEAKKAEIAKAIADEVAKILK